MIVSKSPMSEDTPKCVFCGAETLLLVSGVPVCLKCDQEQDLIRKAKEAEAEKAKKNR